jgi:hypothetical protein
MKHLEHVCSHGNICNIQIKHLQHVFETIGTFESHTCNMLLKHLKTFANIRNTHIKHMNICVKDKHTCNYVYNHSNICNIPIYFCNIHLKLLQYTSETLKIYTCNMRFQ